MAVLLISDPDIVEIPSTSVVTSSRKRRKKVVIEIDGDNDPDAVVVIDNISHDDWKKKRQKHGGSRRGKEDIKIESELDKKFKSIKQFDVIRDSSDHHHNNKAAASTSKNWSKLIQKEWAILERDLPETIFVRVYEDRIDLLRAVIIGPAGTPYHDGLFFFDVHFPSNYPKSPPRVYYHAGGLRLNPNLYACGKVCLSLLNTWQGSGCEKWSSSNSTMLQVLVSIQALVLNAKPYFNEPGYAPTVNTPAGEEKSLAYNENTFLLSCKTMLYSLRRPPKHFEEFTAIHFGRMGYAILVACRAYLSGAQVGCLAVGGVQDVDEGDKSCSVPFKTQLMTLVPELLREFAAKGVDCRDFCPPPSQPFIPTQLPPLP